MDNRDIWVALQRGGLCNNLKCLLSTMRLAERDGCEFANSSPDLASIYPDLQNIPREKLPVNARTHKDWRLIVFEDDPVDSGFSKTRESRGFADADPGGRNIDHEFDRVPLAMRQIYIDVISRLTVARKLQAEIDNAADKLLAECDAAVHMRTWITDHWDNAPNRHRHYFDFSYYENLVEEHGSVFVSSDNAAYLEKLIARFGERVKHYMPNIPLHYSEEAFVSLNLLSKTDKLIGSSLSTFTEMAWWLGGCQSQVTLVPRNRL